MSIAESLRFPVLGMPFVPHKAGELDAANHD
jgi:hypothetical protein